MKKGRIIDIQNYVKVHFDYEPKSCWIADVKSKSGMTVKSAWNRQSLKERLNPCPIGNRRHAHNPLRPAAIKSRVKFS